MNKFMQELQRAYAQILAESSTKILKEEIVEYDIMLNRMTTADSELARSILKTIRQRCNEVKHRFRKQFREEWREFRKLDYEEEKLIGVNKPIEKFLELNIEVEPDTYLINIRIEDPEAINEIIDDKLKEQIRSIGTLDGFEDEDPVQS